MVGGIFLVLAFISGCGNGTGHAGANGNAKSFTKDNPIQALATTGMVADLVRHVGGELVDVTQMFGATVDPHLHKPTRDDVLAISRSDIVFYSGLMLEGKMADTFVKVSRQKPVVAVTEEIDDSHLLEPDDFAGHSDPHVWNDVAAWQTCVTVVQNALTKLAPEHAGIFSKNAVAYQTELKQLNEYAKRVLATIPEKSRILVTSHDAFNYFGRAYGLNVQGVQGLSTESEAGLLHINELVDMLVENDVKAVFVESSVPRKNIDALVEGAKSRGHNVVIGGELFSDAMGKAGTYEGTYIGMLDHNITLVARSLGGDAPQAGFQGKLKLEPNSGS